MTWMAPPSLTLRRKERESDVALSHSSRATHFVLSFSPSFVVLFYFRFVVLLFCFVVLLLRFCRFADSVLSFCRIEPYIKLYFISSLRNSCFVVSCRDFIVLYYCFLFRRLASFFCRFVYLHFVVFSLSLIRERRGALLLALNEESAAKVIAADSSRRIVFPIKIVFNFYLPVQVRALSSLTTKRE